MDPVSFNVGGKIFQVSRYLLDKHIETMLGTASSGYSSPEPIFLDGDAAMFAQVLIYLRHGSITLPVTISKEMFVKELEYYDVEIAPGSVKSESEAAANVNLVVERLSEDIKVQSDSLKKITSSLGVLDDFGRAVKRNYGGGDSGFYKMVQDFEHTKISLGNCDTGVQLSFR
ncbi:hypothetical protein THAOC_33500 [Thalassiosira oceanica]|uniref:Potassium channel tetramerisation-type BTB domain-containing protein n=1 Tax=Thalassiosira oceanica TaxID=159749 RepID=K0RFQ4_THAOC|nr:hypothetical protein THAOC_33500 [Thalassiosira oceanica]|eukprot:EJK47761.1 hypothetical protein THAOC_33500 [Thalassiosira oceanica]